MSERLLRVITEDQLAARAPSAIDAATLSTAASMLEDIRRGGDAAALAHARRLGDLAEDQSAVRSRTECEAALRRLPGEQREVLQRVAERIRVFAAAQRECLRDLSRPIPGGAAGHTCVPVHAAGCYAPGGRYPLPSSVLMTAITARVAGVAEVWVASPRPTDATLAAAAIAGADGVLAIGGVQAVAAMADGLLGVPRCDVIVGPGNRWVTAAKQLVSGRVGIDMLAGPSELLVLADDAADAEVIAADLLAQAEHDDDAVPMLISTSAAVAERTEAALSRQLASLPTAATASRALRNGFTLMARDVDDAVRLCNRIGPEHLEVLTRDAEAVAARIGAAGAIFIGSAAAEVLGDYGAGPNHVLPTGGTARFRAGLSVFTFVRVRTWMRVDDPAAAAGLYADAAALARMESLEGHARASEIRWR
jgi:phosphoribosyl-ATP pyrophosphohydrolase/phosphoribosyl-AMP cyclohydrolase/histidinol dehydrogenase